jgi:magnesium chelatase family protein
VEGARARQRARYIGRPMTCNADLGAGEVPEFCVLDSAGASLIQQAVRQLQLSARGYHRVLKLACTIADLAGDEAITPTHLAEALQYRPRRWI